MPPPSKDPEVARRASGKYRQLHREKHNEYNKAWAKAHPEATRKKHANWRAKNREHLRAKAKQHWQENLEECRRYHREWSRQHREIRQGWVDRNREKVRESGKAWRKNNPGHALSLVRRRQLALVRAIPRWADLKAITAVYIQAAALGRETGVPHHVDHIYPLRGKLCCGFHVAYNLRVVTAQVNQMKSNRMPDSEIIHAASN